MSDFNFKIPCKDQNLSDEDLLKCQRQYEEYLAREKEKSLFMIRAGNQGNRSKSGEVGFQERQAEIDTDSDGNITTDEITNWYSNQEDGKALVDGYINIKNIYNSGKKDNKITEGIYKDIEEIHGSRQKNGRIDDEEFKNFWKEQEGFEERFLNIMTRGDKGKASYKAANKLWLQQQQQASNDEIASIYGEEVLQNFLKGSYNSGEFGSMKTIKGLDISLLDQKKIDAKRNELILSETKLLLDPTGESDLDPILMPALEKHLYTDKDRNEDGLLPNEAVVKHNEEEKLRFMELGCGGSNLADAIPLGQDITLNCKGKKHTFKLKEFQSQEDIYKTFQEGQEQLKERSKALEKEITKAQSDAAPLLKTVNDLKTKLENYGEITPESGYLARKGYSDIVEQYKSAIQAYNDSEAGKELERLSARADLLNAEFDALESEGTKLDDYGILLEAGSLNYNLLDKTFATLNAQFVAPVKALVGSVDNTLGKLFDKEYSDANYKSSMNYYKMAQEDMSNFATFGSKDFGLDGFNFGRYLLNMAADNSFSIGATLLPGGIIGNLGGKILARGLSGAAKKAALATANKMAQNATMATFFVSGTGDQWGRLSLASIEATDKLKQINADLLNEELTPEMKEQLMSDKQFYESQMETGNLRRAFASILYGGMDMVGERLGSLRVISNLQKVGSSYAKRGLLNSWRKSSIDGVKATLSSSYRFTAGIGSELLEESFVNLGTAFVDRNILGIDRGYLDDFSTDFALNTAFTSIALQSPYMANNVMSGVRYELTTLADRKAFRKVHGELMGITTKLENGKLDGSLSSAEIKELEAKKQDLFEKATVSDFVSMNSWTKLDQKSREQLIEIGSELRSAEKDLYSLTSDPQFGQEGFLEEVTAAEKKVQEIDARKAEILKSKKLSEYNKAEADFLKENPDAQLANSTIAKGRVQVYEAALDIAGFQYDGTTEVLTDPESVEAFIEQNKDRLSDSDIDGIRNESAFVDPTTGNLVVNQQNIYNSIMTGTTSQALTAAIAPLHELMHAQIKATKLFDAKNNPALQENINTATIGLTDVIKSKMEDGSLDSKRGQELLDRIDQYDKSNVEEVMTVFSEAVLLGDIKPNDMNAMYGLKNMLNSAWGQFNPTASNVLNPFKTTNDIYSFVSNFAEKTANVQGGKVRQTFTMDSTGRTKYETGLVFSQGDIKSGLDNFVQNPDGSKKYESKEDFQKSDDFANAMNKIERSNLLDGLIRQNVSQEYLDMNPDFVQKTKERISEKFIKEFDPSKNESLFGWVTGKTQGGKGQSILGFAKGDVQNKGKQQVETKSIDDPNARQVAEQKIDETTTTKKDVTPTVSAFDFLKKSDPSFDSKKFENDFIEAQKVLAKEKGINLADPNLTPKQRMEVVPYQVLADAIGIPVKKLTDPKANLTPAEASKAQRVLIAAKPFIKNVVLSKANTDVTTVESKKKGGKPVKVGGETLGLGTKILNTFFNPPKRLGSGKKVRTPKQFDNKKFDEAIGVKDGKVSPDFDARNSQIIKGLLKAVAEQMGARATSKTLDAGPQTQEVKLTQAALDSMKSDLLFSKKMKPIKGDKQKKALVDQILLDVYNAPLPANKASISTADITKQINDVANNAIYTYTGEAKVIAAGLAKARELGNLNNGKPILEVTTITPPTNNKLVDFKSIINLPGGISVPFNVEVKALLDSKGAKQGFQVSGNLFNKYIQSKDIKDITNTKGMSPAFVKKIVKQLNKLDTDAFISDMNAAGANMTDMRSPFPIEVYLQVKFAGGLKSITQSGKDAMLVKGIDIAPMYTDNKDTGLIQLGVDSKLDLGTFSIGKNNPLGLNSLNNIKFQYAIRPVIDSVDGKPGMYTINLRGLPAMRTSSLIKQGVTASSVSMLDGSTIDLAVTNAQPLMFSKKPNPLNKKGLEGINKTLENGKKLKDSPKGKKAIDNLKNNQPKNLDKDFNDIIQENKGIKSEARYSDIGARRAGRGKGKFKFFLPPGAEDFKGLIYTFLGKGKKGEKQFEFFDNNLIKPYQQAVAQIERFRRALKSDYATLLKNNPDARKKLGKKIPTKGKTDFTYDQAIRAFLMDKSGFDLTEAGLSKRDAKLLVDTIAKDQTMLDFAQGLQMITKQDTWLKPNGGFDVQTIQSDLHRLTSGEGRKKFLENSGFIQNSADIFSKANLNKIEATYGIGVREAIEDMMYRMKNGTNRPSGTNRLTNNFNNWVNRSIGAIMFFNRKSALLQTISSVNFVNWSDNNPVKAAMAFANQKQYWSDFAMIFNSPKLKERRAGLKGDINEAELASAVEGATNKAEAALSWLLKKGFLPTQMADSFAIASGGATFYRNRVNTYKKQGMDQKAAEEKAFEDFSRISEESQQSADPSMISEQQASPLGRLILAFQNTPMQYTRLMKRAGQDLINGRGDAKTHISKIIYYGAIQNFIFSALQNALFAVIPGFSGEDEEEEVEDKSQKKYVRIANNMVDTVLRGSGVYGAIGATLKNTLIKFYENEKKDPFQKDNASIILEAVNLSPPIGSKLRKLNNALKTREYEKDVIEERGWEITRDGRVNLSPSYRVLGSTLEAALNIPLERTIAEISALTEMTDQRNSSLERIALALGWRTWDLDIPNEEEDQIKVEAKERKKQERKDKLKKEREEKKRLEEEKRFEGLSNKEINNLKRRDQIQALTKQQQIDSLVALGVSKAMIRGLRLESDRIDKIIEINTK